eukprot:4252500-Pleurochrysis_carterae.AAC.2
MGYLRVVLNEHQACAQVQHLWAEDPGFLPARFSIYGLLRVQFSVVAFRDLQRTFGILRALQEFARGRKKRALLAHPT